MTVSNVLSQYEVPKNPIASAISTLSIQHCNAIHVINTSGTWVYHTANVMEHGCNTAVLRQLVAVCARLEPHQLKQVLLIAEDLDKDYELKGTLPSPFVINRA